MKKTIREKFYSKFPGLAIEVPTLNEYVSSRNFGLFDYRIGHKWLLFRSTKGIGGQEPLNNVDLVFSAVQVLSLPLGLHGVKITHPRDAAAVELEKKYPLIQRNDVKFVYFIESQGMTHFVIASTLVIHENNLEAFDSSLNYICHRDGHIAEKYFGSNVHALYRIL